MKKIVCLLLCLLLFCISLNDTVYAEDDMYPTYSELENNELIIHEITTSLNGNVIRNVETKGKNYLFLPSDYNINSMSLTFDTTASEVWVYQDEQYVKNLKDAENFDLQEVTVYDEKTQEYCMPLRTVTRDEDNQVIEYYDDTLYIMKSSNISSMFINFADSNYGREWIDASSDHTNDAANYTDVSMCMVNENGNVVYNNTLTQIKGRGNTTWNVSPKKPYQIKLNKKTDLLESTNESNKNKTWVLIANALDMTMFRNAMALDLAQYLGLSSSPEYRFVDVYFDGIYRGTYLLCEKVQINDGRLEIKDSEDFTTVTDTDAVMQCENKYGLLVQYNPTAVAEDVPEHGGFLLELDVDSYAEKENCWFKTPDNRYVVVKSPECATKEQMLYISELFYQMWNAARDGKYEDSDIRDILDVDSFSSLCLLNEYLMNVDFLASSSYFYLPEKDNAHYDYKFYAGPAWDFDGSMGARCDREYLLDPNYVNWYGKKYFKSSVVKKAIQEKALDLYEMKDVIFSTTPVVDGITNIKSMAYYRDVVQPSAAMNYKVNDLAKFVLYKDFNSYEEGYDYTYDYMSQRHEMLMNKIITPTTICDKHGHSPVILKAIKATAQKAGKTEGSKCSVCGKILEAQKMTLAQVTGIKTKGVTKSSITITWPKIAGASYYRVQRSLDGKTWKTIKTTNTNSYTSSNLYAGTVYKYKVTALDSTKKIAGKTSSVISISTVCKAPTIKITTPKAGTVKVAITKVKGAKSYKIYKSKDNKKYTLMKTTSNTSYTLTKLSRGKKVYIKVAAMNKNNVRSAFSKIASIKVK